MKLKQIQIEIHEKILLLRKIDRLINCQEFEEYFNSLKDPNKGCLVSLILDNQLDEITNLFNLKIKRDLSEYSVRELRLKASRLYIKHYSGMTKSELIGAITYEQRYYDYLYAATDNDIGKMEGCSIDPIK